MLIKVIWNQTMGDATWELESKMLDQYHTCLSMFDFRGLGNWRARC